MDFVSGFFFSVVVHPTHAKIDPFPVLVAVNNKQIQCFCGKFGNVLGCVFEQDVHFPVIGEFCLGQNVREGVFQIPNPNQNFVGDSKPNLLENHIINKISRLFQKLLIGSWNVVRYCCFLFC
jgi:hypothetical protein